MTKREKIEEVELESIAREFISSSLGGPESEIAAVRARNLRAYNAEPTGEFAPPDIDDRSAFVSSDVADTLNGMMPQLLDVFVADDKAVECVAKKPGPEAEANAKQATGYLNHLFYVRNDGLNVLHDWLHDAALQKVGFVKVWAEELAEDSKQTYDGQTQEQLAAILQDGAQLSGEPMADEQGGLSFTVVDESRRMHFKVACVPPHEMRVGTNAKWGDDPDAIGEVGMRPRYELEELGYDLSNIGSNSSTLNAEADLMLGDGLGGMDNELHDSHKLYEYAELYIKLDADGDGVAEWVQLCLVNGTLLKHEQVDDHPYAEMCLMPRPHAFFGDCPADFVYQIQKEQTNLARAHFDNVQFATNQRFYINTTADVEIGDFLDNRPGGMVRGRGPAGDAITALPAIPLNQSAWQMQEWLDGQRENRTGFNRYAAGSDAGALNKTKGGVEILTQKADMRMRLMTRFAAQAVKKMMGKLLKLSIKHQDKADWLKVNGEWQPINPTEWRDQFNISINVGLGHGTKEQQGQAVMAMVPLQQMGLQVGVVRPEHIGHTIKTFAISQGFKNPDQFGDEAPQGPPAQQLQQQMQEMQQQMQEMGQKGQQLEQENMGLKMDMQSAQLDAQQQKLKADVKAAEIQLTARDDAFNSQVEMHNREQPQDTGHDEIASQVAEQSQAIEQMAMGMKQLTAMVQGALSQLAVGPKQVTINRGPSGDIEGGVIG